MTSHSLPHSNKMACFTYYHHKSSHRNNTSIKAVGPSQSGLEDFTRYCACCCLLSQHWHKKISCTHIFVTSCLINILIIISTSFIPYLKLLSSLMILYFGCKMRSNQRDGVYMNYLCPVSPGRNYYSRFSCYLSTRNPMYSRVAASIGT